MLPLDAITKLRKSINPPDKEEFDVESRILKTDDDRRLFYAVVLEPMTQVTDKGDSHGHVMKSSEIEESAHYFMKMGATVFKGHQSKVDVSVVESFIAPVDYTPEGCTEEIKKGSWVAAVKVHDDKTWNEIKDGEITAFSPGGYGKLIDLE